MLRNLATDPAFAPWRDEALRRGYASSIGIPLVVNDQAQGALTIYASEPDASPQHSSVQEDLLAHWDGVGADHQLGAREHPHVQLPAEAAEAIPAAAHRPTVILISLRMYQIPRKELPGMPRHAW